MSTPSLAGGFDLYLDEAGNTGLKFDDSQQPVFVLAGWIVPHAAAKSASKRAGMRPPTSLLKKGELKGAHLMRDATGQRFAADLVRDLQDLGCVPVYFVAEKRFAVACKIVECLLDPKTNLLLPTSFIHNDELKQDIAQSMATIEKTRDLERLWHAIVRFDRSDLESLVTSLANRIEARGSPTMALFLRGALANLTEVVDDMQADDPILIRSFGLSVPLFFSLIVKTDELAQQVSASDVRIVHDQTSEHEPALTAAYQSAKDSRVSGYLEHGKRLASGTVVNLEVKCISELVFANSKTEPLIQAADVLAALVKKAVSSPNSIHPQLARQFSRVIYGYPESMPRTASFIASHALVRPAIERARADSPLVRAAGGGPVQR